MDWDIEGIFMGTEPTKDTKPEQSEPPTLQDLTNSTREIIESTEAVRSDLADRTETVREQVVDSTQTAKTALADKTEATRKDLADRTEAVRADLADRTDTIRQQVVDATHQARRDVEDRTELTRSELENRYSRREDTVDRKFTNYRTWFVFAIVLFILTSSVLYYLFLNPKSGQPVLIISDVRVTGPTNLCSGETLNFEFDVIAKEVGTYNLWMSTWQTTPPPAVVLFSETEPFVVASEREFIVQRQWIVPTRYEDKSDNHFKPFSPGEYSRDIDITAEGRDTRTIPLRVEFSIRNDCP